MTKHQKHKTPRQLKQRGLRVNEKRVSFALSFCLRTQNGTNSTDSDGMKQARAIMPEIRLNSNNSTCYKSALSVVHSQKMDN